MSNVNNINGISTAADTAAYFLPEPAVSKSSGFWNVLNSAKDLALGAVGGVPANMGGSNFGELRQLIDLQVQVQTEMQAVTMISNVEKSKHESKMSALRNVKV
jgi:hypothetical protein